METTEKPIKLLTSLAINSPGPELFRLGMLGT